MATPDQDRDVQFVDELPEIQRLQWALTCSALTVVPRMTNMSTPAATTSWMKSWVFCGDRAAATVMCASRICWTRAAISSGLIGSAYKRCNNGTASWRGTDRICSRRTTGRRTGSTTPRG